MKIIRLFICPAILKTSHKYPIMGRSALDYLIKVRDYTFMEAVQMIAGIPILGRKKMTDVTRGDIQKLFNTKADYSRPAAELVKTIMNVSFRYAVTNKVIQAGPVEGIGLPKAEKPQQKSGFRTRTISVVPPLAGQGVKDIIASIINITYKQLLSDTG